MRARCAKCSRFSTGFLSMSKRRCRCLRGRVSTMRAARSRLGCLLGLFGRGCRGRGFIWGNSLPGTDMNLVEDLFDWGAWLMNDVFDLLPVPPEREMPAGCLERRKLALVNVVASDLRGDSLRASRLGRLRGLRVWLTSLVLFLAFAVVGDSALLASQDRDRGVPTVIEAAVAVGGGTAVAVLSVLPRQRSSSTRREAGRQLQVRSGGLGRHWSPLSPLALGS